MYVCGHLYTYVHIYNRYVCMYVKMYVCMCLHVCMRGCRFTYTNTQHKVTRRHWRRQIPQHVRRFMYFYIFVDVYTQSVRLQTDTFFILVLRICLNLSVRIAPGMAISRAGRDIYEMSLRGLRAGFLRRWSVRPRIQKHLDARRSGAPRGLCVGTGPHTLSIRIIHCNYFTLYTVIIRIQYTVYRVP